VYNEQSQARTLGLILPKTPNGRTASKHQYREETLPWRPWPKTRRAPIRSVAVRFQAIRSIAASLVPIRTAATTSRVTAAAITHNAPAPRNCQRRVRPGTLMARDWMSRPRRFMSAVLGV